MGEDFCPLLSGVYIVFEEDIQGFRMLEPVYQIDIFALVLLAIIVDNGVPLVLFGLIGKNNGKEEKLAVGGNVPEFIEITFIDSPVCSELNKDVLGYGFCLDIILKKCRCLVHLPGVVAVINAAWHVGVEGVIAHRGDGISYQEKVFEVQSVEVLNGNCDIGMELIRLF